MGQLLSQRSAKTRGYKMNHFGFQKKDLEYIHGQLKLSEATRGQFILIKTWWKKNGFYTPKRGLSSLSDISTIFKGKGDTN